MLFIVISVRLRWPRELNTLQLQKTHANRKSTSKSRKHFHIFDSRRCKCSQQNQIHLICSTFLFWLCCEHLQCVRCQIDKSVFFICRCFFSVCSANLVELSRPPYLGIWEPGTVDVFNLATCMCFSSLRRRGRCPDILSYTSDFPTRAYCACAHQCFVLFLRLNNNIKSSQVTFIYIASLTIQIVTKHCTISK